MPRYRRILYPMVLLACLVTIYQQSWAISIRELLGLESEEKAAEAAPGAGKQSGSDWSRQEAGSTAPVMDFNNIRSVLANLNDSQKRSLLDNPENFKQFVRQEAINVSVLSAARANKIDKDENTAFLMQRSAENILRESYLNKLISTKIPADFPSEQQVREYFDKNQASFFLGERVHVWQIFIKLEQGMTQQQSAAVEQRIRTLRQDILDQKIDFADAAMRHSEHSASQAMGGYMGLVKVSDLKPELTGPLMKLPEGQLTEPIKSDTGVHLLKRGAIVPKQDVSYEQVKSQIRDLLLQQARTQLRQAIFDQAGKTYPVDLSEATIEEWRQQLLQ